MFKYGKKSTIILDVMFTVGVYTIVNASEVSNTVTFGHTASATSNISVRVNPSVRFQISSMNGIDGNPLSVSSRVDSTVSTVTPTSPPNQFFKDESTKANYFGYYISTGLASANQSSNYMDIKVRKGFGESPERSFYLVGNGTVIPKKENDLKIAPPLFTTFASAASNSSHCGPNYRANKPTGINCKSNSTVANMDITQFVKVLNTEQPSEEIVSQLEFMVSPE